jgi:MFS family permease
MVETIKQSLRESKTARWTALAIVSFTMLCGYYFTDVMGPLKPMIEQQLGWSSSQYGFFTSAYAWFNVFLGMLVFGGMILDRMGVRFTGIMATILMILGALLKFYAVSSPVVEGAMLFGWPQQVMIASIGFAIFGVGVEIAGITVSKIIVKWFKGKEMALAMGLEMAAARIGTALALMLPVPIAAKTKLSMPLALGLVLLCVGLIAFVVYCMQDRKLEASEAVSEKEVANKEDAFKISDIGLIVKSTGFWLIAVLCVLFYSAVFPFLKYATDLMIQKYQVSPNLAGILPGLLPFGNILMTPFFGNLYDRKGKGATIMMVGSILLILVHGIFSLPINNWVVALVAILILGIGFSLVPSAMWPSVPKIIPEKQLGTAYAMIFFIQNIGLGGVPALIGWVLTKYCITGTLQSGATAYDYTKPMLIFMCFGILALLVSFILKMDDKRKGYGLEQPNIKK